MNNSFGLEEGERGGWEKILGLDGRDTLHHKNEIGEMKLWHERGIAAGKRKREREREKYLIKADKAVHIEVVTDLTSEAFIAALTRFVSRRGLCLNLYSDCGTNFLGASSHLKKKELNHFVNQQSIRFHFLPPSAPHQGGLWESAVKATKNHLRRVMGTQILTLTEFITLLIKVEAMLNSRPLTPISSDPSEVSALTPGHFLIGRHLQSVPENDFSESPLNRLSRWQTVQALFQRLWKRWHKEYLHTLQQRSKWTIAKDGLKEGNLVLIQEPNAPPLVWPLGRVIATFPGEDGIVRVVQLRTTKGILSRPAIKVFPLPLDA
ncbi:hypothetical protein J437_LFUL012660 [Ladona fulva]|uniref:Integrase catalytic domain-containing protein n=1 Tax=Ladona fulva TaxID=123851 RepID=A0A8K0KF32_LADFU|nr:hypothetical protein J437_LFUL012660 [Ladona fulva]